MALRSPQGVWKGYTTLYSMQTNERELYSMLIKLDQVNRGWMDGYISMRLSLLIRAARLSISPHLPQQPLHQLPLPLQIQPLLVRLPQRPPHEHDRLDALATDPYLAVPPDRRLKGKPSPSVAATTQELEHRDPALLLRFRHQQPPRETERHVEYHPADQGAEAVGFPRRLVEALDLGVHVLVGEGDARVD